MAIIVYAIQVSLAQTAIPSYALVDVLVNSVALSIIKQNVMIILQLHAFKNHVQAINIALWLVPLQHVSATLATLAFHLAILQFHAQPCPVESISIALWMVPPLLVYVMQDTIHLDQLALNSLHLHVQPRYAATINIASWVLVCPHVFVIMDGLVIIATFKFALNSA